MRNAIYVLLYASGIYGLVLWPPIEKSVAFIADPLRLAIAPVVTPLPLAIRCLLALIVFDALAYWVHRAAHASPLLWRIHRVHHSDATLDATTTFRFHVVEIAWRMLLQFLPLYILGIATQIPVAVYVAMLALNVVAHSDLPWRFGPLVGPAYHAVHHRGDHVGDDANFGMFLVVWDLAFRTRR